MRWRAWLAAGAIATTAPAGCSTPPQPASGLPLRQVSETALTGGPVRFGYPALDLDWGRLFIAHMGARELIHVDIRPARRRGPDHRSVLAALTPIRLTATVAEVGGYLRATVRTVLSTYWREPMGSETLFIDDIPDMPHNADQSVRATPQLVDRVLAALPDNYRQILELRFLQSCSVSPATRCCAQREGDR